MASDDQLHDGTTVDGKHLPPLWEIEWRVVDIACSQLGLDREAVTPESRLFEDLNFDSLDAVEFTMELEDQFDITLSDADCQEWFVNKGITLHSIAELVVHRWGTGKANRSRWTTPRSESPKVPSLPVTQLAPRRNGLTVNSTNSSEKTAKVIANSVDGQMECDVY
jgi:acyl carrier protein